MAWIREGRKVPAFYRLRYCNFCGRTIGLQIPYRWCHFNPRSRGGSDGITPYPATAAVLFQSTLPRRERHSARFRKQWFKYFNPRSREGSDHPQPELYGLRVVISIHAPAKGATRSARRSSSTCSHFNPRSREGSDSRTERDQQIIRISIHAPAKGATFSF